MGTPLDKVTIKGFKSFKSLENFQLTNLNILIGGNGAGKSNFIDFFRLLRAMMELSLPGFRTSNLQSFVRDGGGIDDFLYAGPKVTDHITAELKFGINGYSFDLTSAAGGKEVLINQEMRYYAHGQNPWWTIGSGYLRPRLLDERTMPGLAGGKSVAHYVYDAIDSWRIYHFHDTSKNAALRRYEIVEDDAFFRFDGANIAPFLRSLRDNGKDSYQQIVNAVRLVTPFFDDFILKPRKSGEKEEVNLSWRQKGSDYPMQPYHFSDGTIRFICLATALLQPNPPSTILIDEPELGLHPYAIAVLAELVKSAAKSTQIILSTQSPPVVDCFDPENVVVVKRDNGASVFQRLRSEDYTQWLNEYGLGDLWRKNVIAGGPSHE